MTRLDETRRPLDQFVARAERLYTLPQVAVDVLGLTQESTIDVAALTRCIERDPALVGKILRTVNSSLFGLARDVTDLAQAVALLGIKPLKLLVLGFNLPPKLLSGTEQQALSRYWQHALVKAVAARELAQQAASVDGDDAFLAGLLQDIGVLVLLKDLGEPYARFVERAEVEQLDLLALELDTLGFDHRLLSARLLAAWGLPDAFCKMIALTADSPSAERLPPAQRGLVPLLAQAETIALVVAGGRGLHSTKLAQHCHADNAEAWRMFLENLRGKVDELASALDVALPQGASHDEILARAHQQLAGELDGAAAGVYRQGCAAAWPETESLVAASAECDTARTELLVETPTTSATSAPVAQATIACADPALAGLASRTVAECRRRRVPLSLLLIEVDEFNDFVFQRGVERATRYLREFAAGTAALATDAHYAELRDGQFALLLAGSDRPQAVALARRVVQLVEQGRWLPARGSAPATLSIGIASVAMPAKNFPATDLIAAAERCLYGATSGGGNGIKSIDIY